MSPRRLSVLACVVAGLIRVSAAPPQQAGYLGDPWSLLDPKQVIDAAKEISPGRFPDCDTATVDWKVVQVYQADGTARTQEEWFLKVLTERGRAANQAASLGYQIPYSSVAFARLEVIKPGGRVVPVDVAGQSRDSVYAGQMAQNTYDPNDRVLSVGIPGVEVGDLIHAVTRRTVERPIVPGEFDSGVQWEGDGYLRHASYEIQGPVALPLRHVLLRDPVPGTVSSWSRIKGGVVTHHWEVNRVPRAYGEPAMPPAGEVLQRLRVSTAADWPEISRWYWNLCLPHLSAVTPKMREEAAKLTAGAATDADRIKALFYYVANGVRYMGIAPERARPGYEPHDASLTFERKYGVCRDKAALLVALLRSAGFEAYPVLENFGLKMDPDCPVPEFNHAIVGVRAKGGSQWQLLDPTDENPADLLPAWEGNQSYLICSPEGQSLALTPVVPAGRNMVRVRTTGSLDRDGTLEASSEWVYEGINDSLTRPNLAGMGPDARWRVLAGMLKGLMPGAVLESLAISPRDMADASAPIRIRVQFKAPHAAFFENGIAVTTLPWLGTGLGVVGSFGANTGLDKRRYPLETGSTVGLDEGISIQLPGNFVRAICFPASSSIENPCFRYSRVLEFRGGAILCSRQLASNVVEYPPDRYLELKRALKAMAEDGRKTPIFATVGQPRPTLAGAISGQSSNPPPRPNPGLRILENALRIDVQDLHTSKITQRYVEQVLTEAGKHDASELKIPFNPSTGRATLVRAVVTEKDGTRETVNPSEIHVMDADWNATAPRYTGGKVLVANLPGVEIGSTIEVETEYAAYDRPYLSPFVCFQGGFELARGATVELSAPRDLQVSAVATGRAGLVRSSSAVSGGRRILRWTVGKLDPLPDESNPPPDWAFKPCLSVCVGDPASYYGDLESALLDRSRGSANAAKVAGLLAARAGTRSEAVAAIRDYVDRNIRWAGPWFLDVPLRELSSADTTLADGYGHTADRAILLHAMLSAIGLKPEFVLVSQVPATGPLGAIAKTLPLPHLLPGLLVAVAADGATYYLNDTDRYARLGTTSEDGVLALRLSDRSLATVQATPDCQNRVEVEIRGDLAPDGDLRSTLVFRYYGAAYAAKRKFFAEITPEDRRRYFQGAIAGFAPGAKPIGGLATDFERYPGTESYSADLGRAGIVDGEHLYFDCPGSLTFFRLDADRRALPIEIGGYGRSVVRLRREIVLPKGYRLLVGPELKTLVAPDGAGRVLISASDADGTLAIDETSEQFPAVVPPGDYPELVRLESGLDDRASRFVLLERTAPGAAKSE